MSPAELMDTVLAHIMAAGSGHQSLQAPEKGSTIIKDEVDWVAGPTPEQLNWSQDMRDSRSTKDAYVKIIDGVLYMSTDQSSWTLQDPYRPSIALPFFGQAVRDNNPWVQLAWMKGAVLSAKPVSGSSDRFTLDVDVDMVSPEYSGIAAGVKKLVGSRATATLTLNKQGLPVTLTDVLGGRYAFSRWGKVAAATAPATTGDAAVTPVSPGFSKQPTDGAHLTVPPAEKFAAWVAANEKQAGSVHFSIADQATSSVFGDDDGRTTWAHGSTSLDYWSCLTRGSTSAVGFCSVIAVIGGSTVYSLDTTGEYGLSGTKKSADDPAAAAAKNEATPVGDATQHILPLANCITSVKDRGVAPFDEWLSARHVELTVNGPACGTVLGIDPASLWADMRVDVWLDGDGVPLRITYHFPKGDRVIDYDSWGSAMDVTPSPNVLQKSIPSPTP